MPLHTALSVHRNGPTSSAWVAVCAVAARLDRASAAAARIVFSFKIYIFRRLERVRRIELLSSTWKDEAQPLYHTSIELVVGVSPTLSASALAIFGCEPLNRTGPEGYEPTVLPSHSAAVVITTVDSIYLLDGPAVASGAVEPPHPYLIVR